MNPPESPQLITTRNAHPQIKSASRRRPPQPPPPSDHFPPRLYESPRWLLVSGAEPRCGAMLARVHRIHGGREEASRPLLTGGGSDCGLECVTRAVWRGGGAGGAAARKELPQKQQSTPEDEMTQVPPIPAIGSTSGGGGGGGGARELSARARMRQLCHPSLLRLHMVACAVYTPLTHPISALPDPSPP